MYVTDNQPDGTPTWIDLGIPDLDRAMEFYGAVFGWEFDVGPEEAGRYTTCLVRGRPVAAIMPNVDQEPTAFWWNMYFATSDCDATAKRIAEAGGTIVTEPMDAMEHGRLAIARDPAGAQFGLWQGRKHIGAEIVNEPNTLVRNDLVTPAPELVRPFYAAVFDFTLDKNEDMPELDFTFLRRPDGHEIGGIVGDPQATSSTWSTIFEVTDTDETIERAVAHGGAATTPVDFRYGRMSHITDPFGAVFTAIARPKG